MDPADMSSWDLRSCACRLRYAIFHTAGCEQKWYHFLNSVKLFRLDAGRVMPEKHGFLDAIKHIAFEDEPEKTVTKAMPTTPAAAAPALAREVPSVAPPVAYTQPIDAGI